MKLNRSIEQYQNGVPEVIAQGSNAQIVYALKDSRSDIIKLHSALIEALAALEECDEYFYNRADADCDQDGYIPNTEMRLLNTVREVTEKVGSL